MKDDFDFGAVLFAAAPRDSDVGRRQQKFDVHHRGAVLLQLRMSAAASFNTRRIRRPQTYVTVKPLVESSLCFEAPS
jgi:hypothetical protein